MDYVHDKQELLIDFTTCTDQRGSLTFVENAQLPFEIRRVFWIHHTPDGASRGAHAHRTCAEIIVPVTGTFDIDLTLRDGRSFSFQLDNPDTGLFIPAMSWCELRNFAPGTVCLCFASESYTPAGYINDFLSFKHECTL